MKRYENALGVLALAALWGGLPIDSRGESGRRPLLMAAKAGVGPS